MTVTIVGKTGTARTAKKYLAISVLNRQDPVPPKNGTGQGKHSEGRNREKWLALEDFPRRVCLRPSGSSNDDLSNGPCRAGVPPPSAAQSAAFTHPPCALRALQPLSNPGGSPFFRSRCSLECCHPERHNQSFSCSHA